MKQPIVWPSDARSAFAAYETVRGRLPSADFPVTAGLYPSLSEVADHFDGFILDAFGVLNLGDTAIPGAVSRMKELRQRGKTLVVLTNAASYTRGQLLDKYHRLGFDFSAEEVISSRDVAAARLGSIAPGAVWAAISADGDTFDDIDADIADAIAHPDVLDTADGFLFLSTARWSDQLQDRLIGAMRRRPRPLVIANPDIVAPREKGLSVEPGFFAHRLLDEVRAEVFWFGKPFSGGFDQAIARSGYPAHRLAMVGDTLHTDVLGGAAAGCGTVLVADHGLFRGHDVFDMIATSRITPDFVVRTT